MILVISMVAFSPEVEGVGLIGPYFSETDDISRTPSSFVFLENGIILFDGLEIYFYPEKAGAPLLRMFNYCEFDYIHQF